MTTPIKTIGLAMAVSAAGIFAASGIAAAGEGQGKEAKVHCYGVNACKGQNDCKGNITLARGRAPAKARAS